MNVLQQILETITAKIKCIEAVLRSQYCMKYQYQ